MPDKSKKSNFVLIVIIILALVFVGGLFIYFLNQKPELESQTQPTSIATNSADFNQENRLDASGATLTVGQGPDATTPVQVAVTEKVVIFEQTGCSHCVIVEEFLDANPQYRDQVIVKMLDDPQTGKDNLKALSKAASTCGIKSNAVGTPLMFLDEENFDIPRLKDRCLVGDQPIIDYFTAQNLPNPNAPRVAAP